MAKTNYSFEKRKKELERKRKQDEKSRRKQLKVDSSAEETPEAEENEANPADTQ